MFGFPFVWGVIKMGEGNMPSPRVFSIRLVYDKENERGHQDDEDHHTGIYHKDWQVLGCD
jgi:hypothetical protein